MLYRRTVIEDPPKLLWAKKDGQTFQDGFSRGFHSRKHTKRYTMGRRIVVVVVVMIRQHPLPTAMDSYPPPPRAKFSQPGSGPLPRFQEGASSGKHTRWASGSGRDQRPGGGFSCRRSTGPQGKDVPPQRDGGTRVSHLGTPTGGKEGCREEGGGRSTSGAA